MLDFAFQEGQLSEKQKFIFDSRIIRRMIRESMLSTKMQKLLQHCCLGEPDCLAGIMLLFNKLAHNMQARPWSLVLILALLHDV